MTTASATPHRCCAARPRAQPTHFCHHGDDNARALRRRRASACRNDSALELKPKCESDHGPRELWFHLGHGSAQATCSSGISRFHQLSVIILGSPEIGLYPHGLSHG
ncbi:hypothetical protein Q8A67_024395 [Cirrhinus molitorella]|uniref:Uncharacterized protein n=1 Tax=Cirrhinus molitorella TaxID=172907 RepID=A0AA88TBR5_9TELE|nr:hypothetical protein Q8A67_024395 [Cirrhinus molitorella]